MISVITWFCQDCGHRTKEDVKWRVVVCGYCGTEMEVENARNGTRMDV